MPVFKATFAGAKCPSVARFMMNAQRFLTTLIVLLALVAAVLPAQETRARPEGPPALDPARFDSGMARHLLARAGFDGTPEEVARLHALGLAGAVDWLVGYESQPASAKFVAEITTQLDRSALAGKTQEERQKITAEFRRKDRAQFEAIRTWWVNAMISTARPLEEKMVLFWHGHFTSSMRDVRNSYHMLLQNEVLRKQATGSFRKLLHAVAKDPAMLEYLDNNRNRKGSPNENFAREVMELFTMGLGNYTEQDIKEAARAFTGWTFRGNEFYFQRRQHDGGKKKFLGRTGNFGGEEVLDIILEQPVTAEYITRKIFAFFAYDDPDEGTIKALAQAFRESDYELKPLLKALFTSEAFYSKKARGNRVKSPVELVVATARVLGIPADPVARFSHFAATQMGQSLMDPPNVKGWDQGRSWISTSTLYRRYNFGGLATGAVADARDLVAGRGPARDAPADEAAEPDEEMMRRTESAPAGETRKADERRKNARRELDRYVREALREFGKTRVKSLFDPVALAQAEELKTPEEIVRAFERRCLVVPLEPAAFDLLVDYLNRDQNGASNPFDVNKKDADRRLRGMIHLLLSTPEYQVN